MDIGGNGIAQKITAWRNLEEQVGKLLPPGVLKSRDFQKEKLRQLDAIYAAHKSETGSEDILLLRSLKIERNQLANKLYPKLLPKLIRTIKLAIEQRKASNLPEQADHEQLVQQYKSTDFYSRQRQQAVNNNAADTELRHQNNQQQPAPQNLAVNIAAEQENASQKQTRRKGISM
jgi:hypothetical protein